MWQKSKGCSLVAKCQSMTGQLGLKGMFTHSCDPMKSQYAPTSKATKLTFVGTVLPMALGEGWGRMVAACGLTMAVGKVVSEEVKETAGKIEYVNEGVHR